MANTKTTFLRRGLYWILSIILAIIMCVSQNVSSEEGNRHPGYWPGMLELQAGTIWGQNDVWLPGPCLWVQYEPDLGERSIVDFERGEACVQILLKADDHPGREAVLAHLRQGVGNLILREPADPVEMIKNQAEREKGTTMIDPGPVKVPPGREVRIYVVKKGDTLWEISRRFGMKTEDLSRLNNLNEKETLHIGRPVKVFVYLSHDLKLDSKPDNRSANPLLLDQIRMVDGSPVHRSMIRDFAQELIGRHPPKVKKITGRDGIERLAVSVEFNLVPDHVEIRARKFYPMVRKHAEKNKVDPAVVMAIIHTESVFNPMARSKTPAYGLMQLVPRGGGLEAYNAIYEESHELTPQYLYDPENNIELGTAYYNILKNRYMSDVINPLSRTYCAVAAYNAGASNVGYAFISEKSISQATPEINRMDSKEVYERLVKKLPFRESRSYVRKVFTRAELYRDWDRIY